MKATRPVPPAVFLPPAQEPAPVLPTGWWRNDKTLVLVFRPPETAGAVHDDEEYR